MANFSPLTAENSSRVWGTPANFHGFGVLDLLLQRHHSPEANQTLHDVWPSPGLLHGSCPLTEFCQVQNARYIQVLRSPILAALQHGTPAAGTAKLCGVEQRAPPIFDRAAIRLGIGPHSSFFFFLAISAVADWMSTILPHMVWP